MKNPFRQPTMAKQFDLIVKAYENRHPDLIRPSGPHRGNTLATNFWRGYEGVYPESRWDSYSKQCPIYACFRAGQMIRALEGDNPQFPRKG